MVLTLVLVCFEGKHRILNILKMNMFFSVGKNQRLIKVSVLSLYSRDSIVDQITCRFEFSPLITFINTISRHNQVVIIIKVKINS